MLLINFDKFGKLKGKPYICSVFKFYNSGEIPDGYPFAQSERRNSPKAMQR